MIVDYQLVEAGETNDWIRKGYQPFGAPVYDSANGVTAQVVVLEANEAPEDQVIGWHKSHALITANPSKEALDAIKSRFPTLEDGK